MKKLVILTTLTTSLLFGEVYYNNKQQKNTYKDDSINFKNAEIFRVSHYRDYVEVTISTKENGRIRTKLERTSLKEGDRVSGNCRNYEYGEYKTCYIR
ncbi:hypothetical protein [Arcobacter ellisii]|uniref:DUF5666 domain-containing protein n=1 Tax=Arcobacter ellisii TaxID=913109 RepID=A0A347U8J9_9BACT|nr:hypothetical protein [Arcobacter ellisii]AXX95177.1 hypothetical protein AELL_1517 [Arcobacter ellisii]RXI30169.1 hypothetical protein CP962_09195 [Arcobacter ellisii]